MTRHLIFLTILTTLLGCSKPNPTPELSDPIYLDIQSQLMNTQKALAEAESTHKEHQQELDQVVPQTGQIKYAQKHFYESESVINKLKQEIKYLEQLLASRKREDRRLYLSAYYSKTQWPDPAEFKQYQEKKRLMLTHRTWKVESRIQELMGPTKKSTGGHGGGESAPPAEQKSGH